MIEALEAAPADRAFITVWIDEDDQETVTFGEFRSLARGEAAALAREDVGPGDRVVLIMPQGIPAMTTFVGAMMLGAVPAFLFVVSLAAAFAPAWSASAEGANGISRGSYL